jgi:hypothetical protein
MCFLALLFCLLRDYEDATGLEWMKGNGVEYLLGIVFHRGDEGDWAEKFASNSFSSK